MQGIKPMQGNAAKVVTCSIRDLDKGKQLKQQTNLKAAAHL